MRDSGGGGSSRRKSVPSRRPTSKTHKPKKTTPKRRTSSKQTTTGKKAGRSAGRTITVGGGGSRDRDRGRRDRPEPFVSPPTGTVPEPYRGPTIGPAPPAKPAVVENPHTGVWTLLDLMEKLFPKGYGRGIPGLITNPYSIINPPQMSQRFLANVQPYGEQNYWIRPQRPRIDYAQAVQGVPRGVTALRAAPYGERNIFGNKSTLEYARDLVNMLSKGQPGGI